MRTLLPTLMVVVACEARSSQAPWPPGPPRPIIDKDFCRRNPERCADAAGANPPLVDAGVQDGATGLDAGPDAPWVSGRWRLPSMPIPTQRPSGCGRATPLSKWHHYGGPKKLHRHGETFFVDAAGEVFRFNSTFTTSTIVLAFHVGAGGDIASTPGGFFAVAQTPPPDRNDALVRFEDADGEGRVLWAMQRGAPTHPAAAGGFVEVAATETMVAWVHVANQILHFYVADAMGRNARDLATQIPDLPHGLHADGDHMVFVAADDLWLYTISSRRLENLTNDRFMQSAPFLSGDRLVWMDLRDASPTDPEYYGNPEVYFMNLRDRVPVRITHDPPEHPVYQEDPSIRGEWIVWNDLRHNQWPNRRHDLFTSEIYGYHLGTRREYPIAVDHRGPMGGAVIYDQQVYFHCSTIVTPPGRPTTFDEGLYRVALPTP